MSSRGAEAAFQRALAKDRSRVEEQLGRLIEELPADPPVLKEAAGYCLLGGGKRLRPILCLWTHDLLGGARRDACLDAACALECIHNYSLIHDDLPCMDNDDVRRGKATCHRRFGEATAVLTGDLLLTLSFAVLAQLSPHRGVEAATSLEVISILARAAGGDGLIAGQFWDLDPPASQPPPALVEKVHTAKTARLIGASMEVGAVVAGASEQARRQAARAGLLAGRAFQIADDLIDRDEEGTISYPRAVGCDRARQRAEELIEEAKELVAGMGDPVLLHPLLDLMVHREY